jgi:hypothetical protein
VRTAAADGQASAPGPAAQLGDAGLFFSSKVASMTTDQFVEFVASVQAEKQVGMRKRLAHLLETATVNRLANGLNLDPASNVIMVARA